MIKQITTGHDNATGFLVYSSSTGDFGKVTSDDGRNIRVEFQDTDQTGHYLRCQLETITVQQVASGHMNILTTAIDYLTAWRQTVTDQGFYTYEKAGEMAEKELQDLQAWATS